MRINLPQSQATAAEGGNDALQLCVEVSNTTAAQIGFEGLVVYLTVENKTAGSSLLHAVNKKYRVLYNIVCAAVRAKHFSVIYSWCNIVLTLVK